MKEKSVEWYSIYFFVCFGIFGWVLQLIQIVLALFNNYEFTIKYNIFNEFWIEIFLVPIILIFMIIGAKEVIRNGVV